MQMVSDLYARKSTKDQGRSVARQERMWRSDCAASGITPGRVFVDPDFSASRYARRDRPDYAQLLDHIQSANCQMVSLLECTRGSRKMGEWVAYLDLCRDMGVLIRVFGEDEDPQTYDPRRQRDREYLLKKGMDAESEVERLRNRVKPGIVDAAEQGRPPGPLLYGYKRIYGAPTDASVSAGGSRRRQIIQVVDPEKAAIVERVARDTLAGIPLNTQAKQLEAEGVPTPSGTGKWVGEHIRRMLMRPGYEGHRVHDGQIVARDAWPAILDEDTAARLRALFEQPGRRKNSGDCRLRYQGSGAALCVGCRRTLRVYESGGTRRYGCRHSGCGAVSAAVEQMDEVIDTMVRRRLRSRHVAGLFNPTVDNAAVGAARRELQELKAKLADTYAESAKPGGPSAAYVAYMERELGPQIEAAETRLRQIQTPPVLRKYDPLHLADNWQDYAVGERRAVIMGLAEVVLDRVGKGGRWSPHRLGLSRWHGAEFTWGERWAQGEGLPQG